MRFTSTIRPYLPTDQSTLLTLLRLNTPTYFSPDEEPGFVDYLEQKRESYFVIEVNQSVVGCGGFNILEGKNWASISWDILHPNFQSKGLGSELLSYRLGLLLQLPEIQKIIVRTSQLVYTFYQKKGFILTRIVKNYWAQGFDLYEMEYSDK